MTIDEILPPSPLQDEDLASGGASAAAAAAAKRGAISNKQSAWASKDLFQIARPSPVRPFVPGQKRPGSI